VINSPRKYDETYQENINLNVVNNRTPNFIKQTLSDLKRERNPNTRTVGDLSTLFSPMDRSSTQKNQQRKCELNYTPDHMDFSDIFRTFHPTDAEYIFFSSLHGHFSRMKHLSSYKKLWEIKISCIFSGHNG
jgi:hypothetical protein